MKKEVSVFINHILESIAIIESYVKGVNKSQFIKDKKVQDAVIRRLEIIGEAVKNLPFEFTEEHKGIPWSEIARMRDKLIHKYFGVDLDLTFDVVKRDLPSLQKKLKEISNESINKESRK